jgi:methylation protein EvaC
VVEEKFDFGDQPVSNAFLRAEELREEEFFRLAVGICTSCGMVQLMQETPRTRMFHENYPYRSCSSSIMRKHFERTALHLMETELTGPDDLIVEIGCNDGVLLKAVADAGVRHLGIDASAGAVEVARAKGVRARVEFFEESTAQRLRAEYGPAKVIFSANTFSHIAYIGSVLAGVDRLLADDGVFVFEDRYLGDIIGHNYFDQIYDEHFYLFSVRSVTAMAERYGFELVEAERLPVHGGSMRYKFARPGRRRVAGLHDLLEQEDRLGLTRPETFERFGANIGRIRRDLVTLLTGLRAEGKTVAGYGATSRSATVTNFCGIGPDLIPFVSDTTPEKQGRLTPGSHIPVYAPDRFAAPYPDYALLFAWNHADEILAKERRFHDAGGRWIFYVPDVHIV